MENETAAYIAGFLDADGCIGVYHNGNEKWTTNLSFSNVKREILDFIKSELGEGSLYNAPPRENCRLVYTLRMGGAAAARAVNGLLPFIRLKKRQAELLLEFQELKENHSIGHRLSLIEKEKRQEIVDEIKILNKRGFDW